MDTMLNASVEYLVWVSKQLLYYPHFMYSGLEGLHYYVVEPMLFQK